MMRPGLASASAILAKSRDYNRSDRSVSSGGDSTPQAGRIGEQVEKPQPAIASRPDQSALHRRSRQSDTQDVEVSASSSGA
jgi:hypothetical protein